MSQESMDKFLEKVAESKSYKHELVVR